LSPNSCLIPDVFERSWAISKAHTFRGRFVVCGSDGTVLINVVLINVVSGHLASLHPLRFRLFDKQDNHGNLFALPWSGVRLRLEGLGKGVDQLECLGFRASKPAL